MREDWCTHLLTPRPWSHCVDVVRQRRVAKHSSALQPARSKLQTRPAAKSRHWKCCVAQSILIVVELPVRGLWAELLGGICIGDVPRVSPAAGPRSGGRPVVGVAARSIAQYGQTRARLAKAALAPTPAPEYGPSLNLRQGNLPSDFPLIPLRAFRSKVGGVRLLWIPPLGSRVSCSYRARRACEVAHVVLGVRRLALDACPVAPAPFFTVPVVCPSLDSVPKEREDMVS